MNEDVDLEREVVAGAVAALRRRAQARRMLASEQPGSPEAAVSSRLACELDELADEIETEARRDH